MLPKNEGVPWPENYILIYSPVDGIHFRIWIQNSAVGSSKCTGIQIDKEMALS